MRNENSLAHTLSNPVDVNYSHKSLMRSMSSINHKAHSVGNERLENLKKRLEIEKIKGIAKFDDGEDSDGDRFSPGLSQVDKDIVERINKNFKKSEFSFS